MADEGQGTRLSCHVHISGWFLSPDFVMRDGSVPVVVRLPAMQQTRHLLETILFHSAFGTAA